jgi:hypothetical protein
MASLHSQPSGLAFRFEFGFGFGDGAGSSRLSPVAAHNAKQIEQKAAIRRETDPDDRLATGFLCCCCNPRRELLNRDNDFVACRAT